MPIASEQVERIHRDAIVVVDHDHRPIGPDLPLMVAGGVTAKVYQVTCDVDAVAGYEASREHGEGWLRLAAGGMTDALEQIEHHADICTLAKTTDDVRRAKAQNRVAILLGAEGARWLESSLEPLRLFYRLGMRELQLTWAFPNPLVPDGSAGVSVSSSTSPTSPGRRSPRSSPRRRNLSSSPTASRTE